MASLLSDPLFQISGQAPPPNRDFYYFSINKSEVIWRWWKISLRAVDRYSRPGEQMTSHHDFLNDAWLQSEVRMVFGQKIFQYAKALCEGHYDYLECLPDSLLLQIISHLELEDVGQLGRTSHRFKKLCGSEEFWEQAVRQRCTTVSAEVASLAQELGWRSIFFSNKLHLQKLLNRRRLKVFNPDMAEESANKSLEPNMVTASEEKDSLSTMLCHLCIGTDAGFSTNSYCEVDPDPNFEAEVGFDSIKLVADQSMDDIKFREVKASGVENCNAETIS